MIIHEHDPRTRIAVCRQFLPIPINVKGLAGRSESLERRVLRGAVHVGMGQSTASSGGLGRDLGVTAGEVAAQVHMKFHTPRTDE